MKKFELFGIQTHLIPLNPHELRANRTSPDGGAVRSSSDDGALRLEDHASGRGYSTTPWSVRHPSMRLTLSFVIFLLSGTLDRAEQRFVFMCTGT
jgi:hypothetical protein